VRDGERTFLTDWVADPSAAERVDLRLDTVFEQPEMFTISALQSVFLTVLETLQAAEGDGGVAGGDLIGVYVDADDGQLDLSRGCTDTRSADTNGAFAIKAVPGIVNSVRTIASGERVEPADRVNTQEARFQRLLANAPFQPGSATPQVLREEPLREYLDKQSRHPNRRVDAAITAADASAASQAEGAPHGARRAPSASTSSSPRTSPGRSSCRVPTRASSRPASGRHASASSTATSSATTRSSRSSM
jgi:hypothetical protein